ncbi:MAG: DNA processing protein, partial [Planctomycetota bacterium]
MNPSSPFLQLTPTDRSFPMELRELSPSVDEIWVRGDESMLARMPRVALVGSRSPTPYGLEQARRLSRGLARAGVVVVSGLARGIDQASHAAALDAGGATIAVVGSGLDRLWPRGP